MQDRSGRRQRKRKFERISRCENLYSLYTDEKAKQTRSNLGNGKIDIFVRRYNKGPSINKIVQFGKKIMYVQVNGHHNLLQRQQKRKRRWWSKALVRGEGEREKKERERKSQVVQL